MATLRSALLTSLFALSIPIHAIPPTLEPHCLETSTTKPQWVIQAPIQVYDVEDVSFPWVYFWLFNTATETTANCFANDGPTNAMRGTCSIQDENGTWGNPRTTGAFTFNIKAADVAVTQTWSCPGAEGGKAVEFTGTATAKLPRKGGGWECGRMGRDGDMHCNYTLPFTMTPKVDLL